MSKKVLVIGAGLSGLSAASYLAKDGFDVTVLEKNKISGGRARMFQAEGFLFDMGPSWYWMPDIFDQYFADFGKKTSDYYELKRLNPGYRVYFGPDDYLDVPASKEALYETFEKVEPGSGEKLGKFLKEAEFKYKIGVGKMVHLPGKSFTELIRLDFLNGLFRLDVFRSLSRSVQKMFKDPRLRQLLEFPVIFLGATPAKTPALYSLMNYADLVLGTWYPMGGMFEIPKAMEKLAREMGVKFVFESEVDKIQTEGRRARSAQLNGDSFEADLFVAGADYHHVEQNLLPPDARVYTGKYWDKRVMAPSSIIFYLGVDKKIPNLLHHNLFFDADFLRHAGQIYDQPEWPDNPALYVSCTSKTDPVAAPGNKENIVVLIPVAPGMKDTPEIRRHYYDLVIDRLEKISKGSIRPHVIYQRSYAYSDFIEDYNSFKGNAYGLANTLLQTAIFKPKMKNSKLDNFYYTGQLTVPGPGVPPSLISGKVVANEIGKKFK